jgi:hypothetical protein
MEFTAKHIWFSRVYGISNDTVKIRVTGKDPSGVELKGLKPPRHPGLKRKFYQRRRFGKKWLKTNVSHLVLVYLSLDPC